MEFWNESVNSDRPITDDCGSHGRPWPVEIPGSTGNRTREIRNAAHRRLGSVVQSRYDSTKHFREMAIAFPNYPAGPQFLADTLWADALSNPAFAVIQLCGGATTTFYSASDDKVDPRK